MEVLSVFIVFAFPSVLQCRISSAKRPPFNRYCQSVPRPFSGTAKRSLYRSGGHGSGCAGQVYLPSILIIRLLYSLSRRFSLVARLEFSVVTSLEPQSGFHWCCNFYRVKPVAAKGLLPPYRGELYPEKWVLKERTCGSITGKLKTGLTVRQGLCGGAGGIRTHVPFPTN